MIIYSYMLSISQPPKVVAVTGSAGRIGRHLCSLLGRNYEIRPLDIQGAAHSVDLTDREATIRELRGADAIVHSAIASSRNFGTEPLSEEQNIAFQYRMLDVNVKGTYHVFEAARILGIPRVVYLSSLTVALGAEDAHGMEPDKAPCPTNFYAATKLFGEHLAAVYHRQHGIDVIILRLGQPFPLGIPIEEEWKKDWKSYSLFLTQGDIARAVEAALTTGVRHGIYNVVSRHEPPRVDVSAGKEIGFVPADEWRAARGSSADWVKAPTLDMVE
jgi:uronate dehydrogenase